MPSMTNAQSTQILKSSSLFKDIPDNEISKLASFSQVRDLNAGETLFFEKDDSTALFIVSKGTIVIKKGSSDNDENVTQIGAGQHFGEMAFLVSSGGIFEKRSATAEAGAESTVILEVPFEGLQKCFSAAPQVGLAFYKNLSLSLAGRIRKTTEDLAGVRSLRLRHI
jgi:CRP-like cAMP-binding protein